MPSFGVDLDYETVGEGRDAHGQCQWHGCYLSGLRRSLFVLCLGKFRFFYYGLRFVNGSASECARPGHSHGDGFHARDVGRLAAHDCVIEQIPVVSGPIGDTHRSHSIEIGGSPAGFVRRIGY